MSFRLSEPGFFRVLWITAIVLSVGGVLVAAFCTKDAADGGRGGALADALALAALFGTRNYAADTYEALTTGAEQLKSRIWRLKAIGTPPESAPEASELKKIGARISAFETRLKLDAQGAYAQNFALAIATAVGTIFWGFGDIFARWVMAAAGWLTRACG